MELNGTFLAAAISFIIFVFIMNAIFYKPLAKITEERKNFVDDNLDEAKAAKTKSVELLNDREDKLEKSRLDAKEILGKKNEKTQAKKEKLTKTTREKTSQMVQEAKKAIDDEVQRTQEGFTPYIADLAKTICDKITGK